MRWRSIIGCAVVAAVLAGCGGSNEPAAAPDTTTSNTAAATSTTDPPPAPGPAVTGDAADNPACDLVSVEEIQQGVGANVTEVKGLTGPGAYAEQLLSCTWYLDSTDVGIASVSLQWERPIGQWHDSIASLYQSDVDQDLALALDGVGDAGMVQGTTAEAVSGDHIVRVSVLMHPAPTDSDQANASDLLRLALQRAIS